MLVSSGLWRLFGLKNLLTSALNTPRVASLTPGKLQEMAETGGFRVAEQLAQLAVSSPSSSNQRVCVLKTSEKENESIKGFVWQERASGGILKEQLSQFILLSSNSFQLSGGWELRPL